MIHPHTYRKRALAAMVPFRGWPHGGSSDHRSAREWLVEVEQEVEFEFGGRSVQTLWPDPDKLGKDAQGAWYGGLSPRQFVEAKKAWLLATLESIT